MFGVMKLRAVSLFFKMARSVDIVSCNLKRVLARYKKKENANK